MQNRRLATARESALQGRHVRGGEAADARKRDVTYGDVAGDEVTTVDGVTERELQSCERRELPRPDCLLLIASRNRFRLRGRRCRPAPSAADSSHVRYVSAALAHADARATREAMAGAGAPVAQSTGRFLCSLAWETVPAARGR